MGKLSTDWNLKFRIFKNEFFKYIVNGIIYCTSIFFFIIEKLNFCEYVNTDHKKDIITNVGKIFI